MIKVLLADDVEILRVLLSYVLRKAGDMQVVAMASNGQEAVNESVTHCPDVAILDYSMPIMDGLEATKQIREKCPNAHVLMVSMHRTSYYIQRSMKAGVSGYVIKDDLGHELVSAVRTLHQGGQYFSKQVAELAKQFMQGENNTKTRERRGEESERLKILDRDVSFYAYTLFAEIVTDPPT